MWGVDLKKLEEIDVECGKSEDGLEIHIVAKGENPITLDDVIEALVDIAEAHDGEADNFFKSKQKGFEQ